MLVSAHAVIFLGWFGLMWTCSGLACVSMSTWSYTTCISPFIVALSAAAAAKDLAQYGNGEKIFLIAAKEFELVIPQAAYRSEYIVMHAANFFVSSVHLIRFFVQVYNVLKHLKVIFAFLYQKINN